MSRTADIGLEQMLAGSAALPPAMIVQAHPDDEVIGLGGQLTRLHGATFVHVTDGAPSDGHDAASNGYGGAYEYGIARRKELESAIALAGITSERLEELACPDQQASLYMPDIARQLMSLIRQHRPEILFAHPYEGGHPDHDATAFAVHAACAMLAQSGEATPALLEVSSYHMGPNGITPYCFLPPNTGQAADSAVVLTLTRHQQELKRRMFAEFRTQQGTLQYFPIGIECFRPAPQYCFGQPPHPGRLFYEGFNWGMTGHRFNTLAAAAQAALGLEEVL